jgi:hypothetical protein
MYPQLFLTQGSFAASDVVLTMGFWRCLSMLPGMRCEDWALEDTEKSIESLRQIDDEILRIG